MKLLHLLAAVCQLCLVLVNAEADADATAQVGSGRYSYNSYSTGAQPYQTGGPGYSSYNPSPRQYPSMPGSSSYSYSSYSMSGAPVRGYQYQTKPYGMSNFMSASDANSMERYGTLQFQNTGNVVEASPAYSGWQSGSASSNLRPATPEMSAAEAEDMTGYGSALVPESGNVQTMAVNSNMGSSSNYMNPPISSYQSPPISSYPSPPISSYPSPPISSNPTPSIPDYVQQAYPLMPVNSRPPYNNYLPLNNQGQIFTRSYTPLQGSPCTSVCRSRPMYNAQPKCNTACNVRPSCSMTKPSVDYAVQGQTTFCKPKPVSVNLPQPIQGCGKPSCGMMPVPLPQPIYNSGSSCGGGYGCGGSGFNPGFNQGSFGDSGFNQGNSGFNQGSFGDSGFNQGNSGFNQGSFGDSGFNQGNSGFNQGSFGDSGFNQGSFGDSGFNQGNSGFNQGSFGDSGFNQGSFGDSGFNAGQGGYNPGNGCSSGGCGSSYQSGCSSGGCGGSSPTYPEQAVNLPGQLGAWSSRMSGQPANNCVGTGCSSNTAEAKELPEVSKTSEEPEV